MEDHDRTDPAKPPGAASPTWRSATQGPAPEPISLQLVETSSRRRSLAVGTALLVLVGLLATGLIYGTREGGDPDPVITQGDVAVDDGESAQAMPFGTVIDARAVVVGPVPELSDGSTGAVRGVSAGGVRFIAHRACLQANGFDIDLFEPAPQLPGVAPPLPPPPPADLPWRQLTAEERPEAEAATKACRDLQPGQSEWRQWLGCLDQQGLTVVALRGTLIPPAVSLDQARSAGNACRSQRPASQLPLDPRSQCLDEQGAWLVPVPEAASQAAHAACADQPMLMGADMHAMCLIDNGLPGVGISVVVDVAVARAAARPCLHLGPGGAGPGDRCMADRGIFTWLPVTVNWPEAEMAAALVACAQVDQAEADLEREHAQQVEAQLRTCLELAGLRVENVHEQLEGDPRAQEAYSRCEAALPPLPPPRAWTAWERCLAGNGLAVPYDPAVIPLGSVRRALGACLHLEDAAREALTARNSRHG